MSDISSQPAQQTNAEYETAFNQILVEIDCMNEKMAHNRKDIERLKNESDLLKVETRAILAAMGANI